MKNNKDVNYEAQGAQVQNELPERILINENLMYFSSIESEARELTFKAKKLAEQYEALNIGSFTQEIFNELIINGSAAQKGEYTKVALAETKSLSLKNLIANDIDRVFKDLQVLIDDVKKRSFYPKTYNEYNLIGATSYFQFATFDYGRFLITDTDIERMKDYHCRTYITTQEQFDAVENLKVFIGSFNRLTQDIQKLNPAIGRLFTDSFSNVGRYATIENGVATLYTENIIELIGQ